ncbi:Mth938-like domain-containing protein [Sphingomonas baiyangensis]|uniref:Uncharacterized protein n=1 Tax=Sphingomonas baiyangensis TaxID=2572576 RepID=A0A4U1L8R2_9SPHN|nr:Mth938-like domain-containing protein [Sphingomonas baiyangensis]TKD53214.1 hypothetical protein FBR43_02490 [Sphingomonas baiyangensis]
MEIKRDPSGEGPRISGIVGRGFRVDDGVYEGLAITPERAQGWAPPPLDALTIDDLAPLLDGATLPEFVILGTGSRMARPPRTLVAALEARGVGIEPMDSRAAARAWGVLRAELRNVAAALYPLD